MQSSTLYRRRKIRKMRMEEKKLKCACEEWKRIGVLNTDFCPHKKQKTCTSSILYDNLYGKHVDI